MEKNKLEIRRIRNRKSYRFWMRIGGKIMEAVGNAAVLPQTLPLIHQAIDGYYGYGYQTKATYSKESMELALADLAVCSVTKCPYREYCEPWKCPEV